YHSGGVFSLCTTDRSVDQRLGCRTCNGVNASSYPKLCRSTVEGRSAAAASVTAASGHHDLSELLLRTEDTPASGARAAVLIAGTAPAPRRSIRSARCARLRSTGAGTSLRGPL